MNVIPSLDADLDLEYVLELPADVASKLREQLQFIIMMSTGVSENLIKVSEPPSADKTTREKHAKRDSGKNGRGHFRAVRFMPSTMKLGTLNGGRYEVRLCRRTEPEGRETVRISKTATALKEEGRERIDGGDNKRIAGRGDERKNGRDDEQKDRRCGERKDRRGGEQKDGRGGKRKDGDGGERDGRGGERKDGGGGERKDGGGSERKDGRGGERKDGEGDEWNDRGRCKRYAKVTTAANAMPSMVRHDGDDGPLTTWTCRCTGAECVGYEKILQEYLVGRLDGGGDRVQCVYKLILDVMFAKSAGGIRCGRSDETDDFREIDDVRVAVANTVDDGKQRQPAERSPYVDRHGKFMGHDESEDASSSVGQLFSRDTLFYDESNNDPTTTASKAGFSQTDARIDATADSESTIAAAAEKCLGQRRRNYELSRPEVDAYQRSFTKKLFVKLWRKNKKVSAAEGPPPHDGGKKYGTPIRSVSAHHVLRRADNDAEYRDLSMVTAQQKCKKLVSLREIKNLRFP